MQQLNNLAGMQQGYNTGKAAKRFADEVIATQR